MAVSNIQKITAETTDEEIIARIQVRRDALAEVLAAGKTDSADLASYVNAIAEAEGTAAVDYAYRNCLAHGADQNAIDRHLVSLLFQAPGDEWSGRRNDVRRSYADGVRVQVRERVRGW